MAPPPSSWWGSDDQRGTPVVVKMDNPYSLVEIDGPGMAHQSEKARGKNAKQFTWVLLLRAHRAVGCLAWLNAGFWSVLGIVNRRVRRSRDADTEPDAEASGRGRAMLGFLRAFLLLSLGMLAFETVAYHKGWHFPQHLPGNLQELEDQLQHLRHLPKQLRRLPERREIEGWVHAAYVAWLDFRVEYIAWAIHKLSAFCIVLFLVQSVDRIVLCLGCFWIKLRGIKPRAEVSCSGNKSSSRSAAYVKGGEAGDYYPMVLVQMPMCNEKEVSLDQFICNVLVHRHILGSSIVVANEA
jgi:xyloglucan glycosyltransferase 4